MFLNGMATSSTVGDDPIESPHLFARSYRGQEAPGSSINDFRLKTVSDVGLIRYRGLQRFQNYERF
jgi:hypothetical protein